MIYADFHPDRNSKAGGQHRKDFRAIFLVRRLAPFLLSFRAFHSRVESHRRTRSLDCFIATPARVLRDSRNACAWLPPVKRNE